MWWLLLGSPLLSRMRTTRVLAGVVLAIAAVAVPATVVAMAPPAWAQESVSSYTVEAVVTADGSMQVTETIVYDVADEERRGITRTIRRWDDLGDSTRWMHPVRLLSVTVDGVGAPYEVSDSGPAIEVKIGDPAVTITGSHEYVISYVVDGALRTLSDTDLARGNPYGFEPGDVELSWDFIGLDWGMPISNIRIDLRGPGSVLAAQCFAGRVGSGGECADRISGSDVTFRAPLLAPSEALTAVVAFPGSAFTQPPQRRIEVVPLSQAPGRVFWPVVLSVAALVTLSAVVLILRRRVGRGGSS
jgi:hypothetical protein